MAVGEEIRDALDCDEQLRQSGHARASDMAEAAAPPVLKFAVRHGGLSVKITLDEKWQARPLTTSVVKPFVTTWNKKKPAYDHLHEEGLAGVQANETAWIDATSPANKALTGFVEVKTLDLFFETKDAMTTLRTCRVACGDVELKIELATKWLRQPLSAAVVAPFAAAYNKKHGNPLDPKPLDATKLSSIAVDDAPVELADAAKPTCMVLPIGCKRIDLAFGEIGQQAPPAIISAATGDGPITYGVSEREQLKQLWSKVRCNEESLAGTLHLNWTNFRLSPADGLAIGMALLSGAAVRCEGSYGDGLGNLLTLNLESNDLRDEGLMALCKCGGLDRDKVMRSLRELYLQSNRIGDKGAQSLIDPSTNLPTELKIVNLQDNSIGEGGVKAISYAISSKRFKPRHLNLRENNKLDKSGPVAEELREIVKGKYVELKLEPKPSAASVMPSMKEQMKALEIS